MQLGTSSLNMLTNGLPQIVLPTGDFAALREQGPDIWREFWQKIESARVYERMTAGQIRTVRQTLEFFAWAIEHSSQVEPLWDELRKSVESVGMLSSVQRALDDPYPAEVVLYTFLEHVQSHFPVRLSRRATAAQTTNHYSRNYRRGPGPKRRPTSHRSALIRTLWRRACVLSARACS